MRRAVVDVGSNSVLLTVAEGERGNWKPIFETSEVTGLGTDTKKTGLIQPGPQSKTLAAVKRAFDNAELQGARCAAAGTMALRIARNADDFTEAATRQGTPVQIISGDEEARLGLAAVMNDSTFAQHETISVIDPGGHSTELTTATRIGSSYKVSFQKS